jgi:predicted dienelactone hydrolase
MRALAPVVLALAFAAAPAAQAAPVGHRVEHLTVAGMAAGELRDVPVHLWYPADATSAAARPLSTYTSALNGRALIPGKTPLAWRIDAELAREGATVAAGAPFPVIVFSHGSVNDPIDYAHTLEGIASAGFIVAAPQHTNNSQEDVRIDFANNQGATPRVPCNDGRPSPCSRTDVGLSIADRVHDVSAIIDALPAWFGGRADNVRVGMMGHSRGTATALAATGGSTVYNVAPEPRIQAAMGMAIAVQAIANNISIANVKVPLQLVAGRLDVTSPWQVSEYAYLQAASPDKRFLVLENGVHRTFDSTYCDQLTAAGTITAADPNAVLDRQTFDQIAVHTSSGRAIDYCAYSNFTPPVAGLIQSSTGFTVTPGNVPTTGLETDAVKAQMTSLAVDFFRAKLAHAAGGDVSGTVPSTLALTLGPAASFGAFTPGVAKDYTTTLGATVTSTAGDATLSVADPGRLMNGTFSLAQPLQVSFSREAWPGPTSNENVTITFKQAIGANEPLRTGTYSKTLTFTLSTTTP